MLNDKQIKEALEAEANEAAVPADLIRERVKLSGGKLRLRPSLWHKLQIGRRLEVVAVFVVLMGLIYGTMMKPGPDYIFRTPPPGSAEASVERMLLTMVSGFPPDGGAPEPLTHPRDKETMEIGRAHV